MLKALEDDFARLPALLGHATVTPVARVPLDSPPEAPRRPIEDLDRADDERALSARFSSASSDRVIELITQSAAETEAFGGTIAGLLRAG